MERPAKSAGARERRRMAMAAKLRGWLLCCVLFIGGAMITGGGCWVMTAAIINHGSNDVPSPVVLLAVAMIVTGSAAAGWGLWRIRR